MFKVNIKAVIALLVSIGGLASHPEVMGLLPEKWAVLLTLVGAVAQALTQQVARIPVDRAGDI